jgi:hypothetical protein
MKSTRIVVALTASGLASIPVAQTKPPKELRNGREREDADRRGVALWRSAFTYFVEAFAAYAASMHPSTAFSVEAADCRKAHLPVAGRPHADHRRA